MSARVLDLVDRVLQEDSPHGGDRRSEDAIKSPNGRLDTTSNSTGSRSYALRRLRKDAPELHEQVLDGTLTAHAAMVKAGLRRRVIACRPPGGNFSTTLPAITQLSEGRNGLQFDTAEYTLSGRGLCRWGTRTPNLKPSLSVRRLTTLSPHVTCAEASGDEVSTSRAPPVMGQ